MSCPWDPPYSAYSYSPCNINFFHTTVKHRDNLTAMECSAVFMEQHIFNIRVSIFKISKLHYVYWFEVHICTKKHNHSDLDSDQMFLYLLCIKWSRLHWEMCHSTHVMHGLCFGIDHTHVISTFWNAIWKI